MTHRLTAITLRGVCPAVFPDTPDSGVWGKTVEFRRGETYLVKAASGTGKTSLCSFLYGSRRFPEYRGTIEFNGEDISRFSRSRFTLLRRDSLAYLPQDLYLFPELTAFENIELKNRLTDDRSRDEILAMMDALSIAGFADRPVGKLSLGQQQRVAVVRALCQPFDFLLLDEPVSHLDEENNRRVASLIASEASRRDAGIIATSVGADLLIQPPFKTIRL